MVFLLGILTFAGCTSILEETGVEKPGVLYLYESYSGFVLKSFGDAKVQPRYKGDIKNGKPNGEGTETSPEGNRFVGYYTNGILWNGTSYDKNGNIRYKKVNGILE